MKPQKSLIKSIQENINDLYTRRRGSIEFIKSLNQYFNVQISNIINNIINRLIV